MLKWKVSDCRRSRQKLTEEKVRSISQCRHRNKFKLVSLTSRKSPKTSYNKWYPSTVLFRYRIVQLHETLSNSNLSFFSDLILSLPLSLYIYIYSLNGNINIKIYHRKVENKPTYQIHRFPYEMQYSSCLRINSTVASLIQRHQQQWVLIKFQNCINLANKNAKKNILEKT